MVLSVFNEEQYDQYCHRYPNVSHNSVLLKVKINREEVIVKVACSYLYSMDLKVRKRAELKQHAAAVYCLSSGRSGASVLTGSADHFIAEWDIETGVANAFSVKMESPVFSQLYIAREKKLLVATNDGNLHVIDLEKKEEIKNLELHQKGLFDLKYLEKDRLVISFGGDGLLAVWDAENWELKLQLPLTDDKLRRADLNADESKLAVSAADGRIRIFETGFFNEIANIMAHETGANCVAWHPNGKWLVSGGKDAHIRIWDAENEYELLKAIPAHNFAVYDLVFSPDGKYCASASRDKTIKIWDAESFGMPYRIERRTHQSHTHSVNALYWDETTNLLCSGGDDRALMIWELS